MKAVGDSTNEKFNLSFNLKYKNKEHLEKTSASFEEALKSRGNMELTLPDSMKNKPLFDILSTDYTKGIIEVKGIDMSEFENDDSTKELLKDLENPEKSSEPEFAMMMKAIFGGEKVTIVHAPGKILSTNYPKAVISGNTVTFKDDMIEILKTKRSSNKVIQYQK
jgi:hypothetical protein